VTTTPKPGVDEYAPSFAGYVARIAEDEDIVTVLAGAFVPIPPQPVAASRHGGSPANPELASAVVSAVSNDHAFPR